MNNSHRLALIAAQKVYSYLLLGPKLRKTASALKDAKMTLNAKRSKVPIYMLNDYPRVPNFTPFCSTIARFPDN